MPCYLPGVCRSHESGFSSFGQKWKQSAKKFPGLTPGITPFGQITPFTSGKLFRFPNGWESVSPGVNDLQWRKSGQQPHHGQSYKIRTPIARLVPLSAWNGILRRTIHLHPPPEIIHNFIIGERSPVNRNHCHFPAARPIQRWFDFRNLNLCNRSKVSSFSFGFSRRTFSRSASAFAPCVFVQSRMSCASKEIPRLKGTSGIRSTSVPMCER